MSQTESVPEVVVPVYVSPSRLAKLTHRSVGMGTPLLFTAPWAGAPPSGQLYQTLYCVMPEPVTVKRSESETSRPSSIVCLAAVTTGAPAPGSVTSTSVQPLLQLPL